MTWTRWVWCTECGLHDGTPRLHLPDTIHCQSCGAIIGELTDPITVPNSGARFSLDRREVINGRSEETLSDIEWDHDAVAIHDGDSE